MAVHRSAFIHSRGRLADLTALESLVSCECGHAIGLHDSLGCRGTRPRHCGCNRDRAWVLDSAVERSVADHRAGLR